MLELSPPDQLSEVTKLVHQAATGLSVSKIEKAVLEVAPGEKTQRLLFLALKKKPGVLQGQHSDVPATVQKLAHALVGAGAQGISLPACQECQREVFLPYKAPGGGRFCQRCALNSSKQTCSVCGQVKRIYRRADGTKYCRACWRDDQRSFETCTRCGESAPLVVRQPAAICINCYSPPEQNCFLCGREGRVASHVEGESICPRCYYTMRRPRPCSGCGRRRMLTHFQDKELVCAECANAPVLLACPGCGSVEESRKYRLCDECRRPIVIKRILSDETDQIRKELQPLADFLLSHHDKAESFHRWASKKNGSVDLLREIAKAGSPLSADAIIKRASSYQSVAFLLSMLAESGTLPDLDVQSARFESWLRDWLGSIREPADRLILQQYASWGRPRPAHAVQGPRNSWYTRERAGLKHCAQLLNQVRINGYSLATFPQRDLDAFLTGSPTQQDALAKFTQWLTDQRVNRLRVPNRNHQLAGYGYESDQRWQMARRLLRETELPTLDRVGGLLVLLYGLPVTRIVALARSDVQIKEDRVTLTIGKDPIEMPEPMGQAMRDLLSQNEGRTDRWLFPGRNPGQPMSPGGLRRRLRLLGMRPGDARVTALFELAQQMHPRLLSDLLGISITTATAWWRLAAGDWMSYPSLR